jgi:hypothetical protein
MKSVALLAVLTVLLILPPRAMAQGFRGAATGAGNSLAPARSGTTMSPARSGTPGSVIITTTPKPAVTAAPGAPIQSTPHAAVPQFVPPVVHGGGLTVAPANPLRHPPTVVIEIPGVPHRPPFPHRPRPAHRPFPPHRPYPPIGYYPYPGIVIFDSSYYWPNTVITEMAPGVVVEERRYTDAPPAESRTRVSGQLAPFDPTPRLGPARRAGRDGHRSPPGQSAVHPDSPEGRWVHVGAARARHRIADHVEPVHTPASPRISACLRPAGRPWCS